MSNYKESVITGEKYTRCHSIIVDNSLNSVPSIVFQEEEIINFGEEPIHKSIGFIQELFTDTTKVIVLLDPNTNQPTGSNVTYQDVYTLLYSLYIKLATERDNK